MMTSLRFLALLFAATLSASTAFAVEKASAEVLRERQTSNQDQVSLKPLVLFSMRGRSDPFMAYPMMTTTASADIFSIVSLTYNGVVEVESNLVALFRDMGGHAYTLKVDRLFGPDGKVVPGVRGRIVEAAGGRDVMLEQGEHKINYTANRASKRLVGSRKL